MCVCVVREGMKREIDVRIREGVSDWLLSCAVPYKGFVWAPVASALVKIWLLGTQSHCYK